ncbi:serine/threonine-protein kinase [Nocardioides bizhenqiangii]|uniref:non-specific serine/threonine protein kinase n=1 Tax=Nocardioides bizhenqiangii TaxID=3095076 RepID=A0ABZ0ZRU9_9ACTN|nr:serine/threonine-protein kinase [Nocardioides sp. HM61]WQQ26198.1 serine/threonine-protein kinase [Nocardioides sp. HM61]
MTTPTGPAEGFPAPGERIGPFEIVRQLGTGGMGVVFEAVDTALQRRVALKVISPHVAGDPAFRARFTREAQAQASLDSPHVVQVFAHGEADGSLYIASQLIPDGDLGAMVRAQGAPPPRVALELIAQVAAGLADAHATGLVHRDIKPSNVLLRHRGEDVTAYLADFGIARRVDGDTGLSPPLTTQGAAVGTPAYMAPELHTGGRPGPPTDIYSVGCLLWAALVGSAPYIGTTDYQLVTAHVSAPVPQVAAAGPFEREVNRVLRSAMAKHPGERHPSAAALRDDLRRVLATIPAPASVEPDDSVEPPTVSSSSVPTRRVAAIAVGLVSLLGAGAVHGVLTLRSDDAGGTGRGAGGATSSEPAHEDGLTRAQRIAAANIAAALDADADLDVVAAECTARTLVRRSGVDGLQEQGLIDDDLDFVDSGGTGAIDPQVYADIIEVGVGCVFESVGLGAVPRPATLVE